MTISGIDPKYAIANEQQVQRFPVLQVTDYEPRSLDQPIDAQDNYSCALGGNVFKIEVNINSRKFFCYFLEN